MRLFLVLDDDEAIKESQDLRPEGSPKPRVDGACGQNVGMRKERSMVRGSERELNGSDGTHEWNDS